MKDRKAVEELLRLDDEKQKRENFNLFHYIYPDKDNRDFSGNQSGFIFSRDRYLKHLDFFEAGATYRQRLFCAGNRVGKSFAGLYEIVCHATGIYPTWWKGRRFHRPVVVWIGGFTLKMMKDSVMAGLIGSRADYGTAMLPKHLFASEPRPAPGIPDAIESVNVKHTSGGNSTIQFKSYESGASSFAGAAVDLIMFDEEPPMLVYIEGLTRTATTNGIIFTTFTPDRGFSETVLHFFENGEFHEGRVGEKWVTVCGWDNAPHLSESTKRELYASYPPYLRDAKTKGIPYLGSGAIYPILEEDITSKPFQIPIEWPRGYGMDVGWNNTAAIWGAYDKQSDTIHIFSEYKRGQAEPSVHATAIKSRGSWMSGVVDKAARNRSQADGQKLIEIYTELGLDLIPSIDSKVVDSGIQKVFERLSTGRLKIFTTCVATLDEYRIYRRDEKGNIVKTNDHLLDALRYLIDHFELVMKEEEDDYGSSSPASSGHGRSEIGGY